jgi:hypothetical protein
MLLLLPPAPRQVLQSVVCLGFQYNLPPFSMVSDHCLSVYFFILIIFKTFSVSSVYLLRGVPPPIVAVAPSHITTMKFRCLLRAPAMRLRVGRAQMHTQLWLVNFMEKKSLDRSTRR